MNEVKIEKAFNLLQFHIQIIMQKREKEQSQKKKRNHTMRYTDFEFIKILGMGAYGKVQLVQRKGIKYALKIIQKRTLAKQGKQYQAFIERQLLRRMNHPGIVALKTCFQDKQNLYYCLQYCEGGDFTTFIKSNQWKMTKQLRRFYLAEIVNIIQYFQDIRIIHRDLKPENILLSERGHLKLIDFGTAEVSDCKLVDEKFKEQLIEQKKASQQHEMQQAKKQGKQKLQKWKNYDEKTSSSSEQEPEEAISPVIQARRRKATFVGTCFYVPPELLQQQACHPASDLWALGCIMYQLYYLNPPFDGLSQFQIFQKIKSVDYSFPKNEKITEQAIDLIKKLLQKNPQDRLGSNSREGLMLKDLKSHRFFDGVNFQTIFQQDVPVMQQNEDQTLSERQKERLQKTSSHIMKHYMNLMEENPNILFDGIVQKRTFINFNLYYLIIFKNLKMLRIKVTQPGKTRQTQIDMHKKFDTKQGNPAQVIDTNFFKMITKQKVYKFKTHIPQKWVTVVNDRYKELKQKKSKLEADTASDEGQIENQCRSISQMLRGVKIAVQQ